MDNRLLRGMFAGLAIASAMILLAAPAMAQADVMTVTSVSVDRTIATSVVLPIRIRDTPGSLLGNDRAPGLKLQGMFIRCDITGPGSLTPNVPTAASRTPGIASGLTPSSEVPSSGANTFSYNATFQEAPSLIPWNASVSGTGDLFLNVTIPISPATTKGTYNVALNAFSSLHNAGNTIDEIGAGTGPGNIVLNNGTITVTPVELTRFTAE